MSENGKKKKLTRKHVLEQLWQIAAGRSNDVARLAFLTPERADEIIQQMDLTCMAEVKRNGNGAVEIKSVDRIRALELLLSLMESPKEAGDGAESFYHALEAGAERQRLDLLPKADSGPDLVVRPVSGSGL